MDDTATFVEDLAKTTAHWVAYKRLSGMKNAISESLLIIPIAEYLSGHGYAIEAERDAKTLFNVGSAGELNYDIAAERQSSKSKIILEMKYLRGSDKRLYIDLLKLALPMNSNCPKPNYQRLLLVAGNAEYLSNSSVLGKLKDHKTIIRKRDANVSMQEKDELDLAKEVQGDQEAQKFNEKIDSAYGEHGSSLDRFTIEYCDEAMAGEEKVIIFSVGR